MAAGITPIESGIRMEPVDLVVAWVKKNYYRGFDEPEIEYEKFKELSRITEGK